MPTFKTKSEARRYFAALRAALDPDTKANNDGAIRRHLQALPEFQSADTVLCYYPVKGEIDLRPLTEQAMAEGKRVALPVVSEGAMTFREYTGELIPGAFGIPEPTGGPVEPAEGTLCILPGYAYCGSCRLGYGGGYYDRFLSSFRGAKVFACYHDFTARFPTEEHDVPFDITVTEKGKL